MKAYNLKKFKKLVEDADMVYGTVSLNAAVRVPVRVRKKTLLKYLSEITPGTWADELVIYAETGTTTKGHKTLKLV
jgi:hypothetical protein